MESGSAPAAIHLAAAPCGFPGTAPTQLRIQCTHPGHLTYCAATASAGSPHPDMTAAPTSTVALSGLASRLLSEFAPFIALFRIFVECQNLANFQPKKVRDETILEGNWLSFLSN